MRFDHGLVTPRPMRYAPASKASSPTQVSPAGKAVLTVSYLSGDAMRHRSVGGVVLQTTLDVPAPPARLVADWNREVATQLALEPGDVESLPLARARMRWPDYKSCVHSVSGWLESLQLDGLLASSEVALMACRGARYHHDGEQYAGAAFCNLFLSDDLGLDLHFPQADLRIPLTRGTAVVFDTGQPHAVIDRASGGFDGADFPPVRDATLVFLTWELPVENAALSGALGIAFEPTPNPTPDPTSKRDDGQLLLDGEPVRLCPATGRWMAGG